MAESNGYQMRHEVLLPGGRRVQVTYLDTAHRAATPPSEPTAVTAAVPPAATVAGAKREALHICKHCGGELVHPIDWAEESPERWRILMHCPDCDARREGVFGRASVELLDDELDRASAAMLSDYRQLAHANMSEEADLFARALELDLIGPEDF